MSDTFDWPFFTDAHRTFAAELRTWAHRGLAQSHAGIDADSSRPRPCSRCEATVATASGRGDA